MGQLWICGTVPYIPYPRARDRARTIYISVKNVGEHFRALYNTTVYCSRAVPYYSTAVYRVSPYCSRTVAIVRIRQSCRFLTFGTHQLSPAYIRKIRYKIFFTGFFFWTFGNNSTGCRIRCRTPQRSGRTQVRQVYGHFGCIKARIASTTTAEVQAYTRKLHYKIIFYRFLLLDVWKQ
jgi:hypothetical protein